MNRHETERRRDTHARRPRVEGLEGRHLTTTPGLWVWHESIPMSGTTAPPTTAEQSSLIGITAIEFKNTGT